MRRLPDDDLAARLAEIERLPLSFEGRVCARLAALINAADELPTWLTADMCEAISDAVVMACHHARVPVVRVRRLVDPDAAAHSTRAGRLMRPRD